MVNCSLWNQLPKAFFCNNISNSYFYSLILFIMRYSLTITLLFSVLISCSPKIDLNNYLQGGVWCGYSELSGGKLCIEFLENEAYLKVKRELFFNSLP